MLYNQYRPIKFSDVIGQQSTRILLKQSSKNRMAHAYLLFGQSGSGKTTTARIIAMAANCQHKADGEPCGQCDQCKAVIKGNHYDVFEIDGAKLSGADAVNDIKSLCTKAQYYPNIGTHKIYIIDECHRITIGAFNALLKLLEEPPEYLIIILCTTNRAAVPDTIASRCQLYNFDPITPADIAKRLLSLADKEGEVISQDTIKTIAENVNGNLRQAETMLEQALCAA